MIAPFEHFFDLRILSAAGQDVELAAKPDELERIAGWAEIPSLERFEAVITLCKLAQSRFLYKAVLHADAIQSCVVSLAPVSMHIERTVERELHLVSHVARDLAAHGDVLVSGTDEEEGPEDIDSARYDLAAPLLEEFLLALDPYPRAPGVVFESPGDKDAKPESPFAVLKALKSKG
jgi:hypothetical protein